MDAARLLLTAERLINDDNRLQISNKLQDIINALSLMNGLPQEPSYQVQLRNAVTSLLDGSESMMTLDPVFSQYAIEIGANDFFGKPLIDHIARVISTNAMTPAAAQQELEVFSQARNHYLMSLQQLTSSLRLVNIHTEDLEVGDSQIGFRIPRDIFSNELEGWIEELRAIRRIMRAFSELAVGNPEELEIGEISTTDPIIFLIAASPTIALVGKAVSWSIDQWKKVEEIRKVRIETKKISDQNNGALDDLVAQFDTQISSMVSAAVESHAKALVQPKLAAGRAHEQVNDITYALRALMARVERGMTIELRYLPPPPDENGQVPQAFVDIAEVIPTLKFPVATADPVTLLPKYEE